MANQIDLDLEVPFLVDVWLKQTRRSINDLAHLDFAFIIEDYPGRNSWIIRIVKCRWRFESIVQWCISQWGEPCESRWQAVNADNWHSLILIVNDLEDLTLWKMRWYH